MNPMCVKCKRNRTRYARTEHGLCANCYNKRVQENIQSRLPLCVACKLRPAKSVKSEHGLCSACYNQKLRGKEPGFVQGEFMGECKIEGCSSKATRKLMCAKHYQRVKNGIPIDWKWVQKFCIVCGDMVDTGSLYERHRSLQRYKQKKALKQQQNLSEKRWLEIAKWEEVLLKDPCPYFCGNTSSTIDHVLATSKGGSWEENNTVGACLSCNSGKRDFSLLDFLGKKVML